MKIHFWGVRGSLASPLTNTALESKIETALRLGLEANLKDENQLPDFIKTLPWHVIQTAGGDTSCAQVEVGGKLLILDAGTGLRPLGLNLMKAYRGNPIDAHLLLSHTHWDHICGILFFVPAYIPANKVTIYGTHPKLESRIKNQQSFEYFPIPMMQAIKICQLKADVPVKLMVQ